MFVVIIKMLIEIVISDLLVWKVFVIGSIKNWKEFLNEFILMVKINVNSNINYFIWGDVCMFWFVFIWVLWLLYYVKIVILY